MNVLDLFSGIGGFSLGLERAGMRTVAFCEIDPFCLAVLKKHWPHVPCYEDVRELTADRLRADGIAPDVICGGFPCQDISVAGKGAGIEGARSGLWSEYARIISEVRPRYVIVENVAALLGRGLDRVLGDLAAIGFDAEWHCLPASAVGAPHRRDRVWIVAYAGSEQHKGSRTADERPTTEGFLKTTLADAARIQSGRQEQRTERQRTRESGESIVGTNAYSQGLEKREGQDAERQRPNYWPILERSRWWEFEPDVGRVAHGISRRVDRLRSLGNAVVPQIPEIIGRAIIASHT